MNNRKFLGQAIVYVWQTGRWWMLSTVCFMVVFGFTPIATLWVSKELINAVVELLQNQMMNFWPVLWMLLLQFSIIIVTSALEKGQQLFDKVFEVKLNYHLQQQVLQKITTVPLAYFDLPEFTQHYERIHGGQGVRFLGPIRHLFNIGRSLITLTTYVVFLINIHWSLVVLSVVAAIPILYVHSRLGSEKFTLRVRQSPVVREINYLNFLLANRQAAKEIRLFGIGSYLIDKWAQRYTLNAGEELKLDRKEKTITLAMDGLTAIFYVLSAVIILRIIGRSKVNVGDFVALGQAVQGTQTSINEIALLLASINEACFYLKDYDQFLHYKVDEIPDPKRNHPFPVALHHGISIEGVSFQYPRSSIRTLKDVSFTIQPGERIAIVGENGSGKTTLVKCLMGLYPVTSGQISVDNLDINSIEKNELYKNITVIFQDFIKYELSLRENIAIGNLNYQYDESKLQQAMVLGGVTAFLDRFEAGLETHLGRSVQNGVDLSGGQWQKIALARALFSEGQIFILDEPTAALDPQAEIEVFEQFDALTKGKTAIFISHRMAAARIADRVLVVKDGEICEMGAHDELMALDGEYAKMYNHQAQWFK